MQTEIRRPVQAVFLDRDGTIGGTGHFIHPRDFEPYPWTYEAIRMLKEAGIPVFAFTNQTRISPGEVTVEEFQAQFRQLGFDGAYICPHTAEDGCECRKPKPSMLLRAAAEHGLDLRSCVVVGDVGDKDMLAAAAVGAVKVLVRTGWGESSLDQYRSTWATVEPDFVARDLLEAVQWILGGSAEANQVPQRLPS